jgi:hypothetical protein
LRFHELEVVLNAQPALLEMSEVGDVRSRMSEANEGGVVEALMLFAVGYLLVGIGVGIGRWDFDPEEHETTSGIAVVLVLAIALIWPWMIWQRRSADRSLDERYG